MKKIIYIVFAAVLAGFAISCQKVESVSEKSEAVQYTFNITVKDQVGFDSEDPTKGGSSEKYKTGWENNDKIFLFFKPTDGSLLADTYATLTYNGSSWDGAVTGTTSLGNGGTLSAVYVYNLGDVTPEFSTDKWTVATGNTFYNCQTGVSYTVSGSVISASLDLKAPENFVRFYVENATGALTCDKVKGWKDIAIGSDLAVSNVTCTGYMDGYTNTGDSNVKEYYGRIINDGTSLNGEACEFSAVKNGKVYERTATPSSDAKSFKMNTSATGDLAWTEAPGKLPGLFKRSKGSDDKEGTEDDVLVRFSKGNLYYDGSKFNFEANQYDFRTYAGKNSCINGASSTTGTPTGHWGLFGWSTNAASNKWGMHNKMGATTGYTNGTFNDWGKNIGDGNTWRTLSSAEWQYLFNTRTVNGGTGEGKSYQRASINSDATSVYGLILYPDGYTSQTAATSYTSTEWESLENAGCVFLPAAGYRRNRAISEVGSNGYYWSSTGNGSDYALYMIFNSSKVALDNYYDRAYGLSVRLITEVK